MRKLFVIAILIAVSFVMADDITTLRGEKFKGVSIRRVEPDGLVVVKRDGIVKIPFTDLSPELRAKYGYDPQKASDFNAAVQAATAEFNAAAQAKAGRRPLRSTEDITTLRGEKFIDITVRQVEPDGLTIANKDGVAKIPFTDLSPELCAKYGYDPQKEAEFKAAVEAARKAAAAHSNAAAAAGGEAFRKETLLNARAHETVVKSGQPWNAVTAEAAYQAAKAEDVAGQEAWNQGRSPEGFDAKVEASWQKACQAYPSVQEPSTDLRKRVEASIQVTSQSSPKFFRDPEWPFKITKSAVDEMNKETSAARSARITQIDRELQQIEIQIGSWQHGAEVLGGRFPVRKDYQSKYHPSEEVHKLEARAEELLKERDELAHGAR